MQALTTDPSIVGCELQLTTSDLSSLVEKAALPSDRENATSPLPVMSDMSVVAMMTTTSCDICGKGFSRADNLDRHKTSHHHQLHHQGAKLYTCTICWKSFSRRSYLKLHRRIHSGERPFQCQVCGYAFSRHDHLVIHIRTHQGLKLFNCDLCGKAFSRRYYLKVHRRIHTGERPFKCNLCGYAFSRSDHLLKHKRPNKGMRKLSCVPQPHLIDSGLLTSSSVIDVLTASTATHNQNSNGGTSDGSSSAHEMTVNQITVNEMGEMNVHHVNLLQTGGVGVTLQTDPVTAAALGAHTTVAINPQIDLGQHTNILHLTNVSHQIDVHTT